MNQSCPLCGNQILEAHDSRNQFYSDCIDARNTTGNNEIGSKSICNLQEGEDQQRRTAIRRRTHYDQISSNTFHDHGSVSEYAENHDQQENKLEANAIIDVPTFQENSYRGIQDSDSLFNPLFSQTPVPNGSTQEATHTHIFLVMSVLTSSYLKHG